MPIYRSPSLIALALAVAGCTVAVEGTGSVTKAKTASTAPKSKESAKPAAAPEPGTGTFKLKDGAFTLVPKGETTVKLIELTAIPGMQGELADESGASAGFILMSFGIEGGRAFPWPEGDLEQAVLVELPRYEKHPGYQSLVSDATFKGKVSGDAAKSLRLTGTVTGDLKQSQMTTSDAFPFTMSVDLAFGPYTAPEPTMPPTAPTSKLPTASTP